MRNLILLGCLLFFFGCNQRIKSKLLQQQTVQLVKPRLTVSNLIIDSSVVVAAELKMKDVKIYLTSDGSEPNENSKLYKQQLEITVPGIYKFKAFHPEWKVSETEIVEFIKKGKSVDTIIWETKPHEKYQGQGLNTLVNNSKAMVNFMDPEWMGFDATAKAKIVFEDMTDIKSFDIGYLNDPASWIFPPEKISVLVSYDGALFVEKEKRNIASLKQTIDQRMETISIPINEKIRAIKVEVKNIEIIPSWHEGAGSSAWLFMDEWVFN
tara:strand:- start:9218 stop:10018 length:801 start_codon:yes stop_codon:yes gene_type:complete